MQRLNKFIASSGLCSRRKADEYIENGDVVVNGRIVKELGFQVGPKDKVSVEGKLIKPLKLEYYRFYKPAGYITTADDEKGRKTIYDIIPPELRKLKPVTLMKLIWLRYSNRTTNSFYKKLIKTFSVNRTK